MPRVGPTPGSFKKGRAKTGGRQKGTANKRARELAEQAAGEGITPLEVQLRTMRELWQRAHAGPEMDIALATQACTIAKDCAQFVHPRLAAVAVDASAKIEAEVKITHEERRRRALEGIDAAFREVESPSQMEPSAPAAAAVPQPTAQLPAPPVAADSPIHATDGEPDDPGRTIPRDFAREGELDVARDVARLPARYRPPRRLTPWSG